MTSSTVTNKEIAKVLKAAKKILWSGDPKDRTQDTGFHDSRFSTLPDRPAYICSAIDDLPSVWAMRQAAKRVIKERMGEGHQCNVLEDWLRIEHGIKTPYNSKQMQEYRHRWLDVLIKEFSK